MPCRTCTGKYKSRKLFQQEMAIRTFESKAELNVFTLRGNGTYTNVYNGGTQSLKKAQARLSQQRSYEPTHVIRITTWDNVIPSR